MLQVNNQTLLKASLAVFPNPDGVECAYGVAKATFVLSPDGPALAEQQLPLIPVDEYNGDPQSSSIKSAGEMTLAKPSTDILMRGHAYAPGGRAQEGMVSLRVGAVHKSVRVFGDRAWTVGLLGGRPSDPEPFEKVPLHYELAFGGTDPQPRDPQAVEYEPRNPVGRGLVPRHSRASADGFPLPNLEDPANPIRGHRDRPAPACFAPVSGHWEPRKSLAGTYDAAWLKKRAPYLPADFNPRFLQVAPPDLVAPQYLTGGEPVEIVGASPRGTLRFALPACSLEMVFHLDGQALRHVPKLDTVLFEPDEERFCLVWRACQVVDKKLTRLRELEITCREYRKGKGA